jgi:hypothetical protein
MALHRKADALLALRPDVAIVPECSQVAELGEGEFVRVAWTGDPGTKGLAVFARPELDATVDPSHDPALRWFLPIRLGGPIPMAILAVWAMHNPRAGEPPPKLRMLHALDAYAAFLGSDDALLIGDFNNNDRWDTPAAPTFRRIRERLAAMGLTSLYHDRTGEAHGAETVGSLFWKWDAGLPFLIDHCFLPRTWLPRVSEFSVGTADNWLRLSDHAPLVVELQRVDADPAPGPVAR